MSGAHPAIVIATYNIWSARDDLDQKTAPRHSPATVCPARGTAASVTFGLLPPWWLVVFVRSFIGDVAADLDVLAVVEDERSGEILQQLCTRLRIDAEERKLRTPVPTAEAAVTKGSAAESPNPNPRP